LNTCHLKIYLVHPLAMIFISTTLRTLPRDFTFLFNSLRHGELKKASLMLLFPAFIITTCLTVIFETIRGGGNIFFILAAALGASLGNYSGPRDLYFNGLLPKLVKLCCCIKKTDISEFPAVAEKVARKEALEKFDREEIDFKEREVQSPSNSGWNRFSECCSGFWKGKPAQDARADSNFVSMPG